MMRAITHFIAGCLVFFTGLLALPPASAEDSVKLFPNLGGIVTHLDGRPCKFEQEYDFCGVNWRGGGALYTDPTGKYFIECKGIRHENNPFPPPVTPDPSNPETCDSVVVVVDADTCEAIQFINVSPTIRDIPLGTRTAFSRDGSFLVLGSTGGSVVYQAPDFDPELAEIVPYGVEPLGWLDDHHHYLFETTKGGTWNYQVLEVGEGVWKEVFQMSLVDWGPSLRGNPNLAVRPDWDSVFFDEQGFVVHFPAEEGTNVSPRLEAYSFSKEQPQRIDLPEHYSDLAVERIDGVLKCSWAVDGRRFQAEFSPSKKENTGAQGPWYSLPTEPIFQLNRRGELKRISDGSVCEYREKRDGSTIEFLPYDRGFFVRTSPCGRYVTLMGALNPEENPNVGPCDRPDHYRMGYDSVFAIVDVEECRIVRFINIPPKQTRSAHVRFSPDDSLLLASVSDGGSVIYPSPLFQDSLSAWISKELPARRGIPLQMSKRKDSEEIFLWWPAEGGYTLLRWHNSKEMSETVVPWNQSVLPGGYVGHQLLYADEEVVGLLARDTTWEEKNSRPPTVILVPYRTGEPRMVLELPKGSQTVAMTRDETGRVLCTYHDGKKDVSRKLWQPSATLSQTSGQEPDVHPNDR